MKNAVKLFSIGVMIVLLLFNASLLFSQSKGKNIKKGSVYICNFERPKQVAVYGTPAWVFSTMFFIFDDVKTGGMGVQVCIYTINTSTGGLGDAINAEATETVPFSYRVRDGLVYIWESNDEPKDESGYVLILTMEENEYLTPIKTTEKDMVKLSKFVYLGDFNKIKAMSDVESDRVERNALTKLLSLRDQKTNIELVKKKQSKADNSENMKSTENNIDDVQKDNEELDVKPSFSGGEQKMWEFIGRNLKYPQEARENGIQGRVFVSFIVETDGSISNVKVEKGIGGGCDEEAVRVVKAMPQWHPGKKQGKAISDSYVLPFSFRLN
jgi:protein TonB